MTVSGGYPLAAVHRLPTAEASLIAELGLKDTWAQQLRLLASRAQAQQLWRTGLVAPWYVGSSQIRD